MSLTDLTIDELSRGYVDTGNAYECVFCKEIFDAEEVFKIEDRFFRLKKRCNAILRMNISLCLKRYFN